MSGTGDGRGGPSGYPAGLALIVVLLGAWTAAAVRDVFAEPGGPVGAGVAAGTLLALGGILYGVLRRREWGIGLAGILLAMGASVFVAQLFSWSAGKLEGPVWWLLPAVPACLYVHRLYPRLHLPRGTG